MSHFTKIAEGIDVAPLLAQIDAHPELWDQRPERRIGNSPHRETSDIWCRYAAKEAMQSPYFSQRPHRSVWWPPFRDLWEVADVTTDLMQTLAIPLGLGGILITRIPPGKQVYEHDDRGSWHAEHYSTKVWTVLRGNNQCVNTVEDEAMVWKPGEAWSHDNLLRHSVRNDGPIERICLITCFRRAQCLQT